MGSTPHAPARAVEGFEAMLFDAVNRSSLAYTHRCLRQIWSKIHEQSWSNTFGVKRISFHLVNRLWNVSILRAPISRVGAAFLWVADSSLFGAVAFFHVMNTIFDSIVAQRRFTYCAKLDFVEPFSSSRKYQMDFSHGISRGYSTYDKWALPREPINS